MLITAWFMIEHLRCMAEYLTTERACKINIRPMRNQVPWPN
jgi:hypothetical protein